jgi:hypothetical protein
MTNYALGMMSMARNSLYTGCTINIITKLNKDIYFETLQEYKASIFMREKKR